MRKPIVKIESSEESLQQNKPGMRGQSLVFESQFGQPVDARVNLCFAGFHLWWPPLW
jgi:hypothetical protein